MIRRFQKHAHSLATTVAIVMMGMWFAIGAAPCATATPGDSDRCCSPALMAPCTLICEQATVVCNPPPNALIGATVDFSFVPILLAIVPTNALASELTQALPVSWEARRPTRTPLYLKNLALLI